MKFVATNHVYCSSVNRALDLSSTDLVNHSAYKRPGARFPGASLKLTEGTVIIFKSGRLIFNGIKSPEHLASCVSEIENILQARLKKPRLVNMCGTARFDRVINLEKMYPISRGIFDANLHPGIFLKRNRVNVILYHTSCVFTGCRSCDEFDEVARYLTSLINKYYARHNQL